MFTLKDIVAVAIKIEDNGEQAYRQAATRATDPKLATLLGTLAEQEAEHGRWFVELGKKVKPVEVNDELAGMSEAILADIVGAETFSLADVDLSASDTLQEVLATAIELERDTVIFYQMIGGMISDPATDAHLEHIIEEEKGHERLLQQYLEGES